MSEVMDSLTAMIEYAEATKRFADAGSLKRAATEIETLRAKVAELEAGSEPVAYLFQDALDFNGECMTVQLFSPRCDIGTQIPIYTTPQPVKVPEGYALVPLEPTEKMLVAGYWDTFQARRHPDPMNGVEVCYKAMIGAREPEK